MQSIQVYSQVVSESDWYSMCTIYESYVTISLFLSFSLSLFPTVPMLQKTDAHKLGSPNLIRDHSSSVEKVLILLAPVYRSIVLLHSLRQCGGEERAGSVRK